jgi:hypothetical protein
MTEEGERAKRVYEFYRRLLHSDFSIGHAHDWVFERLAEWVICRGVDLTKYVTAQFRHSRPFPFPPMLLGQKAEDKWERFKREEGIKEQWQEELEAKHPELAQPVSFTRELQSQHRLDTELDFMETRLRVGYTAEELLLGPEFPLSPVFRYLLAVQLGILSAERLWREEARLQVLLHPGCQQIYRHLGEETISTLRSL